MASWDINLNDLKDTLADLYPEKADYVVFMREVKLDPAGLMLTGNARTDWHAILYEAQQIGMEKVLTIIEKADKRYPNNKHLLYAVRYVRQRIQLVNRGDMHGLAPPPLELIVDINQPNEQSDSSDSGTKIQSDQLSGEPIDSDNLGAGVVPPDQSADWDSNLNGLRDTLAVLYFKEAEYVLFVEEIGILLDRSLLDGRPVNVWQSILKEVLTMGMIIPVIEKALERAPGNVDLQVAECYIRNLSQQLPYISHLSFSSDELASACKDLGQLQCTTQFLMCWQRIVIRVNKRQPGAPLTFEQCDAIKFSLQDIQLSILHIRQGLLDGHTLLLSASERTRLTDKLHVISDELDGVLRNLHYLADWSGKSNMHGIELRQTIQNQLAKVIQYLDEERSFMSVWKNRFSEGQFRQDLPVIMPEKLPFKLVPLATSLSSVISSSSQNAPVLTKLNMREAMITLFSEQECRLICNDLAEQWKKEAIKYDDLPGNTRSLKIDYLLSHWNARKSLEELRDWLIERDFYFRETLEKIEKKQK